MKGLEEAEEDLIMEKQLAQDLSSALTFIVLGHIKVFKIIDTYIIKEILR